MSQFRIRGIDYADDSLQHGLGKGSGRGRPVGSKNGQVMPGAAYMKDYKITGQKAVGVPATPGGTRTVGSIGSTNQIKTYGSGSRTQSTPQNAAPRSNSQMATAQKGRTSTASTSSRSTGTSTAASKVEKGKSVVESLTGSNTTPVKRNRDMSTEELRALDPVGDWPWSARRVNAAGGLEAREGRQIVYDNPTLNEDYKKQIAKRYGDSDGKSYPKYLEEQPAQENKTATVEEEPKSQPEKQQTAAEKAVEGSAVDNAAQRILGKPLDRNATPPVNARTLPNGGAPAGGSANVTGPRVETAANDIAGKPAQVRPSNPPAGQQASVQETQQASVQNQPQAVQQPAPVQETPEQKNFWDGVGGWFAKAGKDIADTAVGAWNATGKAVTDAANWVADQTGPVGDWAKTAYDDVSAWVGDRGKDFDSWWNGRDERVQVTDSKGRTQDDRVHRTGAREKIGNFLGDVGQGIGNAANAVGQGIGNAANAVGQGIANVAGDAGRSIGDWWNGRDEYVKTTDSKTGRTQGDRVHHAGARENIGNFLGDVGQGIGNAANAVGQGIGNAANAVGQGVSNAANAVGQGISGAADSVGRFVNGVRPGTPEGTPYWDLKTGQYVDPTMPSLGERIGTAANNVGQTIGNAANSAGQWISDTAGNVGQAASNAWNSVTGQNQTQDPLGTLWNTKVFNPNYFDNGIDFSRPIINPELGTNFNNAVQYVGDRLSGKPQQTNWFNDNIVAPVTSAANGFGDFVRNTADSVGQAVGNVGQAANDWWNGTDKKIAGITYGHNNGVRDSIENAAGQAGQWLNDNIATPVSNAANQAGQAVNDWWNGTDKKALGITYGHNNGVRDNIENVAGQAGQWLNDNVATPVSNAANQAGQAANDWWNGTDKKIAGITYGHNNGVRDNIENAANQAGQWLNDNVATPIGNAANGVDQVAGNTATAARAIQAGVPMSRVSELANALANGYITQDEYDNSLFMAMNSAR